MATIKTEPKPQPKAEKATKVEPGMVLIVEEPPIQEDGPKRYKLWTVTHVNNQKKENVRLVAWGPGIQAKATATFPDKELRDPWRLLYVQEANLGWIWDRLPKR